MDGSGESSGAPSVTSTRNTPTPASTRNRPSSTRTPPASPSITAALRSCRPQQIAVSLGAGGAALGSSYFHVELHNVSDQACKLHGYPALRFVDRTQREIAVARRRVDDGSKVTAVALPTGGWGDAWLVVVSPGNFDPGSPDCRPQAVAFVLISLPRHPRVTTRLPMKGPVCTTGHVPAVSRVMKGRKPL